MILSYLSLWSHPLWTPPYSSPLTFLFLLSIKLKHQFLPQDICICYFLCPECFSTKSHDSFSHFIDVFPRCYLLKEVSLNQQDKDIFFHLCPAVPIVFGFTGCISDILHIILCIISPPLKYWSHMGNTLSQWYLECIEQCLTQIRSSKKNCPSE